MTDEWRVSPKLEHLQRRHQLSLKVTVGEIFPDIDKTVIYKELLAYGIDAKAIRLIPSSRFELDAIMAVTIRQTKKEDSVIFVAVDAIDEAYPGNESKYIGLVHELAHFRQALTGELGIGKDPISMQEWISKHHEINAIRWSARQARLMNWSSERLKNFFKSRYRHHTPFIIKTIMKEGSIGLRLHPEQETLPLLQRRPVRVRQHTRKSLK